ncbi:MAG: hypothetical protein AAF713_18205 [Pseudomonadota bacterium]
MKMLVSTLGMIGNEWLAWAAVGLLAALSAVPLYRFLHCPILAGTRKFTAEEAQDEIDSPFIAGPRFALGMLFGIGAIIAGLSLIAGDIVPVYGFLIVVAGVFVVQTEPARLRLREGQARAAAASLGGPEQQAEAADRLRYSHLFLITSHLAILVAVVAALLAF